MEPIFGFLLYFAACTLVAIVASKRGRSWWMFGGISLLAGFPLVVLVSRAGGSGAAAGTVAFLAPLIGFVIALASKSGPQLAVQNGDFGGYKKCPFCAESVRKEAIKCKHCGSELGQQHTA